MIQKGTKWEYKNQNLLWGVYSRMPWLFGNSCGGSASIWRQVLPRWTVVSVMDDGSKAVSTGDSVLDQDQLSLQEPTSCHQRCQCTCCIEPKVPLPRSPGMAEEHSLGNWSHLCSNLALPPQTFNLTSDPWLSQMKNWDNKIQLHD